MKVGNTRHAREIGAAASWWCRAEDERHLEGVDGLL